MPTRVHSFLGLSRPVARWALALGFAATVGLTHAASLPDTGQDQCYDGGALVACSSANSGDTASYPRQDGRYGRDAAATLGELSKVGGGAKGFDYTALDAAGNPTSPSSGATPHPCVRDNVTGLVWEVKTDDGGLHDKDWTFAWYSSDSNSNGGNQGSTGSGTCGPHLANCNTEAYVSAVNAATWCGFNDWRLPTRRELQTLVDYGVATSPRIESSHFPNTAASNSYYWSGSTAVPSVANAWNVNFDDGNLGASSLKTNNLIYLRLVRGTEF